MALPRVGVQFVTEDFPAYLSAFLKGDEAIAGIGRAAQQAAPAFDAMARAANATKIESLTQKMALQKSELALLEKELKLATDKYGEGSVQVSRKQLAIDKLNASLSGNERELTAAQQKADQFAREEQQAALAVTNLDHAAEGAIPDVQQLGEAAKDSGGGFSFLREIAVGALREIGSLAVDLGARALGALVNFGKGSIQVAADYEGTLNRFKAVTGGSLQEAGLSVTAFDHLFLKLGADTQYSSQQAADAAVELAKGGVPVTAIMDGALDATLALAAAGELELAPAAEIVAKQLGVWAETGVSAADVANLLSQAANASTVDVDDLALGLANAGGAGKLAGVSFEDMVTTMAELAPGFSSAADAGTSLKTFLMRLQPTTKPAISAMEDLGLYTEATGSVFYDAQGNFVGMERASELLAESTKDLTQEQRTLALETIFGSDALRAAGIIAEGGGEGFRKMGADMGLAGSAADQAKARQQGYNFAMEQFHGSLETLQIILGRAVLPLLTSLLNDVITPSVNWVMQLAQAWTAGGSAAEEASTMLQEVGQTVGSFLAAAIPQALGYLSQLSQQMLAWVGSSLPGWIGALGDFAVAAGQWVVDAIPGLLQQLGAFGQQMIGWVMSNLPTWGAALVQFGIKIVTWITDALPGLANNLGQFFNQMANWVVSNLPAWISQLQQFGLKAIQWVLDALPGLANNLGQFAGTLIGWVGQTMIDLTPKLFALAEQMIAWIWTDVLPKLPEWLGKIVETLMAFFEGLFKDLTPKLTELATKFYLWVTADDGPVAKLPGELEKIAELALTWIGNLAKDALKNAGDIGKGILDGIIKGLAGLADQLYNALTKPVEDAWNGLLRDLGIKSPSRLFYDTVGVPIGQGIAFGARDTLEGEMTSALVEPTQAAIDETAGAVKPNADAAGDAMGKNLASATGDAIVAYDGMVLDPLAGVIDKTKTQGASKATDSGAAVGQSLVDAMAAAIGGGGDTAGGMLDSVLGQLGGQAGGFGDVGALLGGSLSGGLLGALGGVADGAAGIFGDLMRQASGVAGSIAGLFGGGGGLDLGGVINPPAGPGQIIGFNGAAGGNTVNYHYSPTYAAAPVAPSQDFALMRTFAGA